MSWRNDVHGLLFSCREAKLYYPGHTHGMKLSQLAFQSGVVRILTYSLPDLDYARRQFERRPYNIWLICHSKFHAEAQAIKDAHRAMRIATHPEMHSKVLMISPKTLYIGSANFGDSGWHETTVGLRSAPAHDAFLAYSFNPAWEQATELQATLSDSEMDRRWHEEAACADDDGSEEFPPYGPDWVGS
jgi:hypothetical protein